MKYWELEAAGFESFGEADSGGGYDWNVFGVCLKDGVFYWASDAGCSCNSSWDSLDFPGDFDGHGTQREAITALFNWRGGTYGTDGESLLNKLMDYQSEDTK